LGIGVAVGAVLQLLVVVLGMVGMGFKYHPWINFKDKSFREVIKILPARSLTVGVDYINGIIETRFASKISIGAVTNFENALLLHNAPIALIGTSISTAAFPRLTDRLAQGRTDLFRKEFVRVLRIMIWVSLPVVIVSYFARGYLARIIFARSNREIALIFGFLCIAIFFRILYTLIARYFYAYKDTKTPLYVTLFAIGLNIILTYNLAKPSAYGIVGLALAQCIVAVSEILIMVIVMMLRDHKIFDKRFYGFLGKAAAVSSFDVFTGYFVIRLIPLSLSDQGFVILLKVTVFASVIFFVHTAMSFVFGLKESQVVVDRIKRTILKPVKI